MNDLPALILAPAIGLVGVLVGYWLNARRADRALRRDLVLERYRQGQQLFDEIVSSAGERFVALQRWLWAIEDPDAYETVPVREQYFALVPNWNAAVWSRRARLHIMLGADTARGFVDYRDDARTQPLSLHYMFVAAHRAVLAVEAGRLEAEDAQTEVDRLNHAWSNFAIKIAAELETRGRSLLLLKEVPPVPEIA